MGLKTRFAVCCIACCMLVAVCACFASSAPFKIYDQTGLGGGNNYYCGGVFDGVCYLGHNGYRGEVWNDRQINGTALLKYTTTDSANLAKSCIPLGGYIYMGGALGGLFRSKDWGPAVKLNTGTALPESLATDGTYIFATDGNSANYNKIHKYIVNHDAGTVTEAPGWPVSQGTIGGATDTRFRAVSYYNGKLYAANAKVGGPKQIYEIDCNTGSITALLSDPNLIPVGTGETVYQCVRYGDKLFLIATDDKLHTWKLIGGTWTLTSSDNLGVGDLYGIAVKGDGTNAKYAWITHLAQSVSFWDLDPYGTPCSVADARNAGNNYPVAIQNGVVTAIGNGGFWVQDESKPLALHVLWSGAPEPVLNKRVNLNGIIGTSASGEKQITANAGTVTFGADATVKPLFVTNKNLVPATGSAGLANDGLLVTIGGRVTYANWETGACYIDDGSGVASDITLTDGTPVKGIKVLLANDSAPSNEDYWNYAMMQTPCYMTVTGVVKPVKLTNGTIIRTIGVRSDNDIKVTVLPSP